MIPLALPSSLYGHSGSVPDASRPFSRLRPGHRPARPAAVLHRHPRLWVPGGAELGDAATPKGYNRRTVEYGSPEHLAIRAAAAGRPRRYTESRGACPGCCGDGGDPDPQPTFNDKCSAGITLEGLTVLTTVSMSTPGAEFTQPPCDEGGCSVKYKIPPNSLTATVPVVLSTITKEACTGTFGTGYNASAQGQFPELSNVVEIVTTTCPPSEEGGEEEVYETKSTGCAVGATFCVSCVDNVIKWSGSVFSGGFSKSLFATACGSGTQSETGTNPFITVTCDCIYGYIYPCGGGDPIPQTYQITLTASSRPA